ncbi:hypothetical protein GCM10022380_41690 [Amycolatopsis tucumanensis]|uniref:Uncharacterized protein n=1 Tax=Amycolatopsis tucumanensis TaxID=401106 RepID=A0ABP7IHF6_9PSEU
MSSSAGSDSGGMSPAGAGSAWVAGGVDGSGVVVDVTGALTCTTGLAEDARGWCWTVKISMVTAPNTAAGSTTLPAVLLLMTTQTRP